jgi:hypothetical protein
MMNETTDTRTARLQSSSLEKKVILPTFTSSSMQPASGATTTTTAAAKAKRGSMEPPPPQKIDRHLKTREKAATSPDIFEFMKSGLDTYGRKAWKVVRRVSGASKLDWTDKELQMTLENELERLKLECSKQEKLNDDVQREIATFKQMIDGSSDVEGAEKEFGKTNQEALKIHGTVRILQGYILQQQNMLKELNAELPWQKYRTPIIYSFACYVVLCFFLVFYRMFLLST